MVAGGHLDRQRVRMAMAAHGRNRHYRWNMISRRHWLETARKCRFAAEDMDSLIEECCDRTYRVIEDVGSRLPSHFPAGIADAIFKGVIAARDRLLRAFQ
jgi:serine/threonine-protein kinase HipA